MSLTEVSPTETFPSPKLDQIPLMLPKHRRRVYSFRDLEAFDLLPYAVWIFDIRGKSMWWSNEKGLEFWGADSLESLLARDFATGMSKATENRNNAWLAKYQEGESNNMDWVFHPNGGRDGPKECTLNMSGIYVSAAGSTQQKLCQLCVVEKMIDSIPATAAESITKRRMEMMKHFPAVARQFNMQGNLMDQNSEALEVFGSPATTIDSTAADTLVTSTQATRQRNSLDGMDDSLREESPATDDFLAQFVDVEEGKRIWEYVKTGYDDQHEYSGEILQETLKGREWHSIKVRSVRDPITSEPVVIYSARNISKIMKAAQDNADREARKKNEFLAIMAHEIRTPLHQVVGFIDLLGGTELTPDQMESIQMIQVGAQALCAVINDILDFTKLEAGKMKLESIPLEVRMVVDSCVGAIQAQAESKGLKLSKEIDDNIPVKLVGDPNRFRQVLSNMLTNAAKFTSKGGEIHITAGRHAVDDGTVNVRFSVRDTGIGMSKEQQTVIFSPYQQADASVSRNYGGTGLGLAICKSLVESMGGKIGVKSMAGSGSTFWFEIPFQRYNKLQLVEREGGLYRLSSHGELIQHVPFRVLVAEDNKINQKVVCKMLEQLGHKVEVADNGKEALEAVISTNFDVVLMDWQMPVMDGIDATKEIRCRGFSMDDLPIIGLTASIQNVDWQRIGMNDCLKKPTRLVDLKKCLKNLQSERTREEHKSDC